MRRFREWLPIMVLFIIPIVFLILHAIGYQVYIIDGEKYPWIINTDKIIAADSTHHSYVELLTSLEQKGLVLSPQEFTNNTYNFFSWLLTILVTVISIVAIFFGISIDKKQCQQSVKAKVVRVNAR